MHRWIRYQFSRAKKTKCLVLIGLPATGKTSFALSLPGRVNIFKDNGIQTIGVIMLVIQSIKIFH